MFGLLIARTAAASAGLLLAIASAAAQGTAQERSACMGDAFRFCTSDIPDVSRIESCLERRLNELSPACKAEFKPRQSKKTEIRREHFR
ncbi:MAG: hypothetical protein AB7V13_12470 [Pseudorhodoplanes sp.]